MAVVLEPGAKKFVEKMSSNQPIHTIPIEEGRKLFGQMQSGDIYKPEVTIEKVSVSTRDYGNVSVLVYRPKNARGKLPMVIFLHGAGWVFGDNITHDRLVRDITVEGEVAVVFVNYTLSPEARYPIAIEQAYEVTKYMANNADKFRLDSSRIAVVGDSVGGNMAAAITLLAKKRKDFKLNCQVLIYPVTNANFDTNSYKEFANGPWLTKKAMEWFWDNYLPNKEARKEITASPLQATIEQLRDLPPALVIVGENDVLRDEGNAYAHKLIEADVPVTAKGYMATIHDFMLINDLAETPACRDAVSTVSTYLRKSFKK